MCVVCISLFQAISENSVVVMTKPALTIIKITEGDSADPVWFNLEVIHISRCILR